MFGEQFLDLRQVPVAHSFCDGLMFIKRQIRMSRKLGQQLSKGSNFSVMIERDNYSRYMWLYSTARKSDATNALEHFLASVRANGTSSVVKHIRSDNGGEIKGAQFRQVCLDYGIKQEFTTAGTSQLNGVAERGLHLVQEAAMAAMLEAPRLFPYSHLPPTANL